MREEYFAGLDLGQSHDYTALAVVERAEEAGEWDAVTFAYRKRALLRLRHLERAPLGTPYPEIVARVRLVMGRLAEKGRSHLAVDATGVGRPVVDWLRRSGLGCGMWPVVITGGEREGQDRGWYRVPKRDLIVGLQVLWQRGDLQAASGLELWPVLRREMGDMRVRVTGGGHEQFGAWRDGEHDDLVLAVALACWGAGKVYPRKLVGDVGWCVRREESLLPF